MSRIIKIMPRLLLILSINPIVLRLPVAFRSIIMVILLIIQRVMLTSYLLHILKQILTSTNANKVEDAQSNKDAGDMEKISITKTTIGIKKSTEGIVYYMHRNK